MTELGSYGSVVSQVVARREEVLERYYPNGRLGGLRFEGACPVDVGRPIELHLRVNEPLRHFRLKGVVGWARRKGSVQLQASWGVDFVADDAGAERLMAFARGQLADASSRGELRHSVDLAIRLVHGGEARKEWLADLSLSGAFIRSWSPLPPGESVELVARLPRSLSTIRVLGRVAWVRPAGQDPGMGIQFVDRPGRSARDDVERLLTKMLLKGS